MFKNIYWPFQHAIDYKNAMAINLLKCHYDHTYSNFVTYHVPEYKRGKGKVEGHERGISATGMYVQPLFLVCQN